MAAALEHHGELRTVRCLTGALQAAEHEDGRRGRRRRQACLSSAHQSGKLLVDDLDDHLRGRQTLHDLGADGAFAYLCGKFLGYLIVDVSLEKRETHFPHGFLDIAFAELSLGLQPFKSG